MSQLNQLPDEIICGWFDMLGVLDQLRLAATSLRFRAIMIRHCRWDVTIEMTGWQLVHVIAINLKIRYFSGHVRDGEHSEFNSTQYMVDTIVEKRL